ncbi:MAG: hypothetical protein ACRC2T_08910, partial [Thermoguttaceae bacterium]
MISSEQLTREIEHLLKTSPVLKLSKDFTKQLPEQLKISLGITDKSAVKDVAAAIEPHLGAKYEILKPNSSSYVLATRIETEAAIRQIGEAIRQCVQQLGTDGTISVKLLAEKLSENVKWNISLCLGLAKLATATEVTKICKSYLDSQLFYFSDSKIAKVAIKIPESELIPRIIQSVQEQFEKFSGNKAAVSIKQLYENLSDRTLTDLLLVCKGTTGAKEALLIKFCKEK